MSFFKSDTPSRVDDAVAREAADAALWRACCKAVDYRDKRTCRACGRKSDPDAMGLTKRGHRHHIVYRSAGGESLPSNVVTLCAQDHSDEHRSLLKIEGDANVALTFYRRDRAGDWYVTRREVAVGHFDRD